MSDQDQSRKTEKPTPKRVEDFRKKGDIAISRDLAQTAAMLGGGIGLMLLMTGVSSSLLHLMQTSMSGADGLEQAGLGETAVKTFVACVAPVAIGALIGYLVASAAQLGWPPAFKMPKFDLGKVFSMGQISQLISPKSAAGRVSKAAAKVLLVGVAIVLALRIEFRALLEHPNLEAGALASRCAYGVARVGAFAIAALAALAALDYYLARRRIANKMKMAPEEVKREHREQEGDPHQRAARKRRARELAGRRHAVEVPTADVVLVNPTHYAVAIRYNPASDGAPRVVAKGRLATAARIREIARKNGVPILRRPPLTRLIYKLVREGHELPVELYQVVAEVLAYIYRVKRRLA